MLNKTNGLQVRVVDGWGQPKRVIEMTGSSLTIGRLPDNDLVLDSEVVSRQHVRLDWDGVQMTVTDLGSRNGTMLEGRRLKPQKAQAWEHGEALQVGYYWLKLDQPARSATQPARRPKRRGAQPMSAATTDRQSPGGGKVVSRPVTRPALRRLAAPMLALAVLLPLGFLLYRFLVPMRSAPSQVAEPVIDQFSPGRSPISLGDQVSLNWTVRDATSLILQQSKSVTGLQGEIVRPGRDTTYTLIAINKNKRQWRQCEVKVLEPHRSPAGKEFLNTGPRTAVGEDERSGRDDRHAAPPR
jgi:hypothetical protein